jgi:hypothetical protein
MRIAVDRHLSVFLPYDRPPHHEDQLTRAAMVVMRTTPLARDALLARVGAPVSARLPEAELDIQARDVLKVPASGAADELTLRRLISVFLSPDVGRNLSGTVIAERIREQRLDGVLRFGDELVVVIESKIRGDEPSDQAEQLRSRGIEIEHQEVTSLGWHELIEDWWALLERGLLAPAEKMLMDDFIAFTEEHFAHLLPFTTLGRAGENDQRRQRRLMALMKEVVPGGNVEPMRRPDLGAVVMLEETNRTTQRIALMQDGDKLALCTWLAELKPQAQALYRTGRSQRLAELLDRQPGTWQARPNVHLAFRNAPAAQRLYLTCGLEIGEYIRNWAGTDFARVGACRYDTVRASLWPWLRARHYAAPEDDQRLETFLKRLGHRDTHLRPSIKIRRTWPWPHAAELDEHGTLVTDIRTAARELLHALQEPLPPGLN